MDSAERQILIFYHHPCFDGLYSLMNLVMVLKTKFTLDSLNFDKFYSMIEKLLDKTKNKLDEKNLVLPKSQGFLSKYGFQKDPLFFNTKVSNYIKFIPVKQSDENIIRKHCKQHVYSNSILILLDYFARSLVNVEQLSQHFKYIIVIDHHQSALQEFGKLQEFDEQKKILQFLKKNIFVQINMDYAANELVIQFLERLFVESFRDLLPYNVYQQLIKFGKHVSDWDLFVNKLPESDPLVLTMYLQKFDLDVNSNPNIFYQLFQLDFKDCVQLGYKLQEERQQKIQMVIQKRKLIELRGIKIYAVECQDTSLINEMATKMATLSAEAGMENVGAVFRERLRTGFPPEVKIYLRSNTQQGLKEFRSDLLAKQFGGGGHVGAASFIISKMEFRDMLIQ